VLSLDLLRAESREEAVTALLGDLGGQLAAARATPPGVDTELVERSHAALLAHVRAWPDTDGDALQAQLRELALCLGRTYAAALLARHAAHRRARHGDDRAAGVARRYAERWLGGSASPALLTAARR
jgi:acyl-CoA dehydrogenase